MGPRVPFVSNPFGAISRNKVVKTKQILYVYEMMYFNSFVHLSVAYKKGMQLPTWLSLKNQPKCMPKEMLKTQPFWVIFLLDILFSTMWLLAGVYILRPKLNFALIIRVLRERKPWSKVRLRYLYRNEAGSLQAHDTNHDYIRIDLVNSRHEVAQECSFWGGDFDVSLLQKQKHFLIFHLDVWTKFCYHFCLVLFTIVLVL